MKWFVFLVIFCFFLNSYAAEEKVTSEDFSKKSTRIKFLDDEELYSAFVDLMTGRKRPEIHGAHLSFFNQNRGSSLFLPENLANHLKKAFEKFIDIIDPDRLFLLKENTEAILAQDDKFWINLANKFEQTNRLDLFREIQRLAVVNYIEMKKTVSMFELSADLDTNLLFFPTTVDYSPSSNQQRKGAIEIQSLIAYAKQIREQVEDSEAFSVFLKRSPVSVESRREKIRALLAKNFWILSADPNFNKMSEFSRMNWVITHFLRKMAWKNLLELRDYSVNVLRSLFSTLDPHSSFLSSDEAETYSSYSSGQFSGIGVRLEPSFLGVRVFSVIRGGPSIHCLRSGDLILWAKEKKRVEYFSGLSLSAVISRLKGKVDSMVEIGVMAADQKTQFSCLIERKNFNSNNVENSSPLVVKREGRGLGIIKLNDFNKLLSSSFRDTLREMNCEINQNSEKCC